MAQDETLGAMLPDGRNRDELVLAYAAGELGPEDEAMVEKLLASHPELQETVALYWSLRLLLATDALDKPSFQARARNRAVFDSKGKHSPMHKRLQSLARKVAQRAPLVGLAALAILLLVLPFGVSAASDTNPGESLYPVKRSVESLKLALTFNPGRRAEFNIKLADVRVREITELISRKQYHLLDEPLADYEMHVTNAVRGLGALPGDDLEHRTTATHLEYGLEKIRRSLAPVSDASPPEVKANVTQLINKADVAEAFLKADKDLVLNANSEPLPTSTGADDDMPPAVPPTQEPPIETPVIARPTRPPMGVVPTDTQVPTKIPPGTVPATETPPATRVPDTSTITAPTVTATTDSPAPIATAPFTPTMVSTLEPIVTITPTSLAEITPTPTLVNTTVPSPTPTVVSATDTPIPTLVNTTVPSPAPTVVSATDTPIPTPRSTVIPATGTAVPSTPTEILATGAPSATRMPIVTDTPVQIETATTAARKETPTAPGMSK